MLLHLVDYDEAGAEALSTAFGDLPAVEVKCAGLLRVSVLKAHTEQVCSRQPNCYSRSESLIRLEEKMAKYVDLSQLDYFGSIWANRLVAVGWVESPEQCNGEGVELGFFESLIELLVNPWQPFAVAGSHRCLLCRFTGGPDQIQLGSRVVALGTNNLFLPDGERVYVAPASIAHYIDAHGYCPPSAFQAAVRKSPPMRSMAYLRSVQHLGLHKMDSGTQT